MDLQDRVTDLESRLAFQDDTIETLNDILVTQQRAVERLQLQMTALLNARKKWAANSKPPKKKRRRLIINRRA